MQWLLPKSLRAQLSQIDITKSPKVIRARQFRKSGVAQKVKSFTLEGSLKWMSCIPRYKSERNGHIKG